MASVSLNQPVTSLGSAAYSPPSAQSLFKTKSIGGAAGKGAIGGASVGSAFGPIGSAVGAVVGAGLNMLSTVFQNRYNRKQADKEYQRNLEQWNRENEYNSPSAQMQRLKEAGLNPNLMYANANGANTSAGSPAYNATQSGSPDMPFFSNIMSLAGLKNQINQTSSNIALQRSQELLNNVSSVTESYKQANTAQDTISKIVQREGYRLDNRLKERLQDYQVASAMWQNEIAKMNMLKLSYDTDISKWESKLRQQEANDFWPFKLRQYQADTKYKEELTKRYLGGTDLLDNQTAFDILYGVGTSKDIKHPNLRSTGYRWLNTIPNAISKLVPSVNLLMK